MSSKGPPQPAPTGLTRPRGQRQYLIPSNRRLRHIHGISLRNLALAPATRARGTTIDDDALPNTHYSPSKLLALRGSSGLAQSQSASDLKAKASTQSSTKPTSTHAGNGHTVTPRKPRRQSTREWTAATPSQRQLKVQDAILRHMADVFFSLHVEGLEEPLYISEVAERVMNPNFCFFDLDAYCTSITRKNGLTIKFWAKHDFDEAWSFVLDLFLDLRSLQFVGTSIEDLPQQLLENCVLVHMTDGIYAEDRQTSPETDPFTVQAPPTFSNDPSPKAEPTSSYDTLMRLSTLDACVQDALSTHSRLASEIKVLIDANHDQFAAPIQVGLARDALSTVTRAVGTTRKQLANLNAQANNRRQELQSRRDSMRKGRVAEARSRILLSENQDQLRNSKSLHAETINDIAAQRRRIVTDLHAIYPIEPASASSGRNKRPPSSRETSALNTPRNTSPSTHSNANPLAFTIRALPLPPSSTFTSPTLTTSTVSAALGHTSHVLLLLSTALSIPLPYPLHPSSSTSTVEDPISLLSTPAHLRRFPLFLPHSTTTPKPISHYSGTSAHSRFEYAVFLLNKDVECLAGGVQAAGNGGSGGTGVGLRILDVRQTLANLKYVILVVTAGRGDVPGRKRGAAPSARGLGLGLGPGLLRGLVGLEGGDSARSSRRGSGESAGEAGRVAEAVRRRLGSGAGDGAGEDV